MKERNYGLRFFYFAVNFSFDEIYVRRNFSSGFINEVTSFTKFKLMNSHEPPPTVALEFPCESFESLKNSSHRSSWQLEFHKLEGSSWMFDQNNFGSITDWWRLKCVQIAKRSTQLRFFSISFIALICKHSWMAEKSTNSSPTKLAKPVRKQINRWYEKVYAWKFTRLVMEMLTEQTT